MRLPNMIKAITARRIKTLRLRRRDGCTSFGQSIDSGNSSPHPYGSSPTGSANNGPRPEEVTTSTLDLLAPLCSGRRLQWEWTAPGPAIQAGVPHPCRGATVGYVEPESGLGVHGVAGWFCGSYS